MNQLNPMFSSPAYTFLPADDESIIREELERESEEMMSKTMLKEQTNE